MILYTLASNQTVITDTIEDTTKISFFSYDRLIAECYMQVGKEPKLNLISDLWDFSNTTRKHFKTYVNKFTWLTYKDKKDFMDLIESNTHINTIKQ